MTTFQYNSQLFNGRSGMRLHSEEGRGGRRDRKQKGMRVEGRIRLPFNRNLKGNCWREMELGPTVPVSFLYYLQEHSLRNDQFKRWCNPSNSNWLQWWLIGCVVTVSMNKNEITKLNSVTCHYALFLISSEDAAKLQQKQRKVPGL